MFTDLGSNYPKTLPAGYCVLTNGENFMLEQPNKTPNGRKYMYRFGPDDSLEDAVEHAWRFREYEMRKRERDAKPQPKPAPYVPVNPELCKTDK